MHLGAECKGNQEKTGQCLAPKTMATSALARASDLAAFTHAGWLSGTTPRPMAVARKGTPVASTRRVRARSAWEKAAPLPTTNSGLQAWLTLDCLEAAHPQRFRR